MDMNKLLHVSTYAGRIMLESGAETYFLRGDVYGCK